MSKLDELFPLLSNEETAAVADAHRDIQPDQSPLDWLDWLAEFGRLNLAAQRALTLRQVLKQIRRLQERGTLPVEVLVDFLELALLTEEE